MKLFKRFRIIEIEGKFIAQKRCFLFDWAGINPIDFYLWHILEYQILLCSFDTIQEAREHLKKYKEFIKKPKIKYYYDNE